MKIKALKNMISKRGGVYSQKYTFIDFLKVIFQKKETFYKCVRVGYTRDVDYIDCTGFGVIKEKPIKANSATLLSLGYDIY